MSRPGGVDGRRRAPWRRRRGHALGKPPRSDYTLSSHHSTSCPVIKEGKTAHLPESAFALSIVKVKDLTFQNSTGRSFEHDPRILSM
jgi:hypothetical protein